MYQGIYLDVSAVDRDLQIVLLLLVLVSTITSLTGLDLLIARFLEVTCKIHTNYIANFAQSGSKLWCRFCKCEWMELGQLILYQQVFFIVIFVI